MIPKIGLINVFAAAMLMCVTMIGDRVMADGSGVATERVAAVPDNAGDICPVLIGESLPKMVLTTVDGGQFDVNAAVAEKPAVIIFYRGGW